MNTYLFILMATIIVGLLPYIIGIVYSFIVWENLLKGEDHWFLIRCCVCTGILGFLSAIATLMDK